MKVHRTIEFDRIEFETLKRVDPAIRIAFPLDPSAEKRTWKGRDLHRACSQKNDELNARAVWAAWDQARELEKVLEQQSDVDYWLEQLPPEQYESVDDLPAGANMAFALAEAREGQLRNVLDALEILTEAVSKVGSRPDDNPRGA